MEANPGMTRDAIRLACHRSDLEEVRICLDQDFRYRSCGIYVEEDCDIARELYLSLLVDRETSRIVIIASTEGLLPDRALPVKQDRLIQPGSPEEVQPALRQDHREAVGSEFPPVQSVRQRRFQALRPSPVAQAQKSVRLRMCCQEARRRKSRPLQSVIQARTR